MLAIDLVQTERGVFRHVGQSRVVPAEGHGRRGILAVGDVVTLRRQRPPRGTWKRYDGRSGRVVSINHETYPDSTRVPRPLDYVEVGVLLGEVRWFRLDELVTS